MRTQKNEKFPRLGLETNQCSTTTGTEVLKKSYCLKEIQASKDVSSVAFYRIAFRSSCLKARQSKNCACVEDKYERFQ